MKKLMFFVMLAALLAAPSMAVVVLSDDFSDGNRDGWFINNDDADNNVTVSGGAMVLSDTSTATDIFSAVGNFAAADLSSAGAKVTLTLEFQNLENQVYPRGIGIGLYDSKGTAITADTSGTEGADDSGWYMYTRRNPALHRLYENNNDGISYDSGAARAADNQSTFGYADGNWWTYKLEIEAVADLPDDTYDNLYDLGLDLLVTLTVDEGGANESVMSYLDKFTLITNFDEVGIESMKGNDFMVDNVVVDYVPEPATMLLLGLGGLLIRRRKQEY